MNRRESLTLLLVATAGHALPAVARASRRSVVIYDGRYRQACEFAAGAERALDCREDVALLWYASGLAAARDSRIARGMTTAADALVIADCASRAGLQFARVPHAAPAASPLVYWTITRSAGGRQPA